MSIFFKSSMSFIFNCYILTTLCLRGICRLFLCQYQFRPPTFLRRLLLLSERNLERSVALQTTRLRPLPVPLPRHRQLQGRRTKTWQQQRDADQFRHLPSTGGDTQVERIQLNGRRFRRRPEYHTLLLLSR